MIILVQIKITVKIISKILVMPVKLEVFINKILMICNSN